MINTVTISLKEYHDLKNANVAFEKGLIRYEGAYGYYEFITPDKAFAQLSAHTGDLKDEIKKLRSRSLLQRIINKKW